MTRPCICSAMSDRSPVLGSTSATGRGYNETVGAEAKHGFGNTSSVSIHYIATDSQNAHFAAVCDCACPPVIHARLRRRFGGGGQSMECASGKPGGIASIFTSTAKHIATICLSRRHLSVLVDEHGTAPHGDQYTHPTGLVRTAAGELPSTIHCRLDAAATSKYWLSEARNSVRDMPPLTQFRQINTLKHLTSGPSCIRHGFYRAVPP